MAADIKENGQRLFPIIIGEHEGPEVIVDGRNRFAACQMAEVEPKFEMINGHDPKALILSVNIKRRHMTAGQRAMATAVIYPEPEKGGRGKTNPLLGKEFSGALLHKARTVLAASRPLAEAVLDATTRIKQLQPTASNRQIAKVLGVGHQTISRDAGPNEPLSSENVRIISGENTVSGPFGPLSGAAAAKVVDKKQSKDASKAASKDSRNLRFGARRT